MKKPAAPKDAAPGLIEARGLKAMHMFDPERAHGMAIWSLKNGLAPGKGAAFDATLQTTVFSLPLPSPIGVARL